MKKETVSNDSLKEKIEEILTPYPDPMSRNDFRIVCHIGTRTSLYLLQSGLVPCKNNGKKTRCYKIAKKDVAEYLYRRESDPMHYTPPSGWYAKGILAVHDACYRIHRELLEKYGMNTDIVFSRPNYCKIDLMPANNRGENLFLQEGEAARLQHILQQHGIDSIETVIAMAESFGTPEMPLRATTDAKYLEVGPTGKSDNVDALFARFGFAAEDCCFWGDEFIGVTDSIFGSDAGMLTQTTQNGDFYDVSDLEGVRPGQVKRLGGGIQTFLTFLREQ